MIYGGKNLNQMLMDEKSMVVKTNQGLQMKIYGGESEMPINVKIYGGESKIPINV